MNKTLTAPNVCLSRIAGELRDVVSHAISVTVNVADRMVAAAANESLPLDICDRIVVVKSRRWLIRGVFVA